MYKIGEYIGVIFLIVLLYGGYQAYKDSHSKLTMQDCSQSGNKYIEQLLSLREGFNVAETPRNIVDKKNDRCLIYVSLYNSLLDQRLEFITDPDSGEQLKFRNSWIVESDPNKWNSQESIEFLNFRKQYFGF